MGEVTKVLFISRLLGRMGWLPVVARGSEDAACLQRRLSKLGQYVEAMFQNLKSSKTERERSKSSVHFKPEKVKLWHLTCMAYLAWRL
jgi:hypothetical protein